MAEESIDNFLKRVGATREPLSEQEKKEAMIVAWKVRDIAKGKIPKGKEFGILTNAKQTERFIIYAEPLAEDKPPWVPRDSNLQIDVLRSVQNAMGGMVNVGFDSYYISSSGVIKQTVIYPSPDQLEEAHFQEKHIPREPVSTKKARLSREQSTQEIYHPDKEDLTSLLSDISSAKPLF